MTYEYRIINHTKKERVHFNNNSQRQYLETNSEATIAVLSYLLTCNNDDIKIFDDDGEYIDSYKDVDLSKPNNYEPMYRKAAIK
jgi:hypothetical protein